MMELKHRKPLYTCPCCGYIEAGKKSGKDVVSDMINMQYAPTPGKRLVCPKCKTQTHLMPWGTKPHDNWFTSKGVDDG